MHSARAQEQFVRYNHCNGMSNAASTSEYHTVASDMSPIAGLLEDVLQTSHPKLSMSSTRGAGYASQSPAHLDVLCGTLLSWLDWRIAPLNMMDVVAAQSASEQLPLQIARCSGIHFQIWVAPTLLHAVTRALRCGDCSAADELLPARLSLCSGQSRLALIISELADHYARPITACC
jgi:hypothetical protein